MTTPTLSRKEREFARREQEILATALTLLANEDWQSVTVEQIARQVDIGKGTIYKHFASKEEIYGRLTLDFYRGLLTELQGIPKERDIPTVLREIIVRGLLYHQQRPQYRFVTQYCQGSDFKERTSPALQQAFDTLDNQFSTLLEELLHNGIAQGVLAPRPLQLLIYGTHATFGGAVQTLWNGCMGNEVDTDEYIDMIAEFILAGLTGQP